MSRAVEHGSEPWLFGEVEKGWWTGDDPAGRPKAGRGDAPYLESLGNTVAEGREGQADSFGSEGVEFVCRALGCRCRFCSHCCKALGLKLRKDLVPVLGTFGGMLMLTLTIDPKLFPDGPEAAYWHVRKRRGIAELVKALHRAGHLRSRRFFYVVEWQKNGWPHWHVLVEADFVPIKKVRATWGKNRPSIAPKWEGHYGEGGEAESPEFGWCWASKCKFASAEHAANYALKYLLKLPEQGFPDWVLDSTKQIRMFSTSRGLLPGRSRSRKKRIAESDENIVVEPVPAPVDDVPFDVPPPERRTIRERLKACGEAAGLFKRRRWVTSGGVVGYGQLEFVEGLNPSFREVVRMLGLAFSGQRSVVVTWDQLPVLQGDAVVFDEPDDGAWSLGDVRRNVCRRPGVVGGGVTAGDVARDPLFDAWNAGEIELADATCSGGEPPWA